MDALVTIEGQEFRAGGGGRSSLLPSLGRGADGRERGRYVVGVDWNWGDFWSQVIAALLGAGAAIGVAWRLFVVERKERLQDRAEQQRVRAEDLHLLEDARAAEAERVLWDRRRVTVGKVIAALDAKSRGVGDPVEADHQFEVSVNEMLLEGTPESYLMYQWIARKRIYMRYEEGMEVIEGRIRGKISQGEVVRAMLLEWVAGDPEGVYADVLRDLAEKVKPNLDS